MSRTEPIRDFAFFGQTSAAIEEGTSHRQKVLDDLMKQKIKERLESEIKLRPDSDYPGRKSFFWGTRNIII